MRISIFGLGYVGAVTAGCLADRGHSIVGVDVQAQKVEEVNQGKPPIIEPGLVELFQHARAQGRLRATQESAAAIQDTDISFICVGTPSANSGALDLTYVRQVVQEAGAALRRQKKKHVLIVCSTMLPGSTQSLAEEYLQDLLTDGRLQIFYLPEFMREGSAVNDFQAPSLVVVGTADGQPAPPELRTLFGDAAAYTDWKTAELVKYACNAFHATKIVFANEIARVGKHFQVDSRRVMSLLCQDTRLNLSPHYLQPGNPFGGSCLPKDVRALNYQGSAQGLVLPLLASLLPSNESHLQSLLAQIKKTGLREIVVLGLSFKANTDDLREGALVEIAQRLLEQGYALRIYDPQLNLAALVGRNKRLIDTKMPHLASLLQADLARAVGPRGLLVISQRCAEPGELACLITPEHQILDVNGWPELKTLPCVYHGFCW
jgi:GDP-mannose 6-dehydrogenase